MQEEVTSGRNAWGELGGGVPYDELGPGVFAGSKGEVPLGQPQAVGAGAGKTVIQGRIVTEGFPGMDECLRKEEEVEFFITG